MFVIRLLILNNQINILLVVHCYWIKHTKLFKICLALTNQTTVWDGVVVSPLDKAYEKPPESKDGDAEDMDADAGDEAMETTDN